MSLLVAKDIALELLHEKVYVTMYITAGVYKGVVIIIKIKDAQLYYW